MGLTQEIFEGMRLNLDKYVIEKKRDIETKAKSCKLNGYSLSYELDKLSLEAKRVYTLLENISEFYALKYDHKTAREVAKIEEEERIVNKLKDLF